MKKAGLILVLGLILGASAFAALYYVGTSRYRAMMNGPEPELAWLKTEFHLSDAEFARIERLHEAYLPQCADRCRLIESQNTKLRDLLAQSTSVTPEIQALLLERAKTRAECEAAMLKHFLAVSQTMPPDQGARYLAWVEQQTFVSSPGMEQQHQAAPDPAAPSASPHP